MRRAGLWPHGAARSPVRRTSRRLRFRLRRQLFWWAGATIFLTGNVTVAVVHLVAPASPFRGDLQESARGFVARRFAEVWERPEARRALTQDLARSFRLAVQLHDTDGRLLEQTGSPCGSRTPVVPVMQGSRALGELRLCFEPGRRFGGSMLVAGLLAASLTLWAASAWLARRLSRPFVDLVRVAREIGDGKLSSRMQLGREQAGEAAILAEAINEMAARIERQLADQRELLAAVSHELRTPLTRLRVLVELADEQGQSPENRRQIEREVAEIDALVGKLLASSRLDFDVLDRQPLDAVAAVESALERAGLSPGLLVARDSGVRVPADATLLARALANLIENAARHGGGLEALVVASGGDCVRFEALDRGPGFAEATRVRAFEPFFRGSAGAEDTPLAGSGAALGLGLSLVARIAQAHGGRAYADNRAEGGARVVLELPLRVPKEPGERERIDSSLPGR